MENKIIIDFGSFYIKVGFSNENKPRYIIPSTIGKPRFLDLSKEISNKAHYVGSEAIAKKGILSLKYPIENGIVTNWDNMQQILEYIINEELKINTEDYSAIITESPINTSENREEITKIMFELFKFQNLYIGLQQELAANSIGLKNGLIVDSGHTSTLIAPIINGLVVKDSIAHLKFGGRNITEYLIKLLNENGNKIHNNFDFYIINEFKEKYGFISLDQMQQQQVNESEIKLTNGQTLKYKDENYKSTELLFNPSLNQINSNSIQKKIYETLIKFNRKEVQDLLSNIVLIGGNTKFNGFESRLEKELKELISLDNHSNLKITRTLDPLSTSWFGASLLESSIFNSNSYTRLEYEEMGPSIIYSKQL